VVQPDPICDTYVRRNREILVDPPIIYGDMEAPIDDQVHSRICIRIIEVHERPDYYKAEDGDH